MGICKQNEIIDEFGRFEKLKATVDQNLAKAYFEKKQGKKLNTFAVRRSIDTFFRDFIIEGGFDIG